MQKNYTCQQFNRLQEPRKYDLLESYGIYLEAYRYEDGYKVALFSIFQYYCEVWLHEKTDAIHKAVAFSSYKKLDPYLERIDISTLCEIL